MSCYYYCLATSVDSLHLCILYELRASSLLLCLGAGPCSSATGRDTGAIEFTFCIERNSRNSNQFVFHRLSKAPHGHGRQRKISFFI